MGVAFLETRCLRVRPRAWTLSEPPRGSGGVPAQRFSMGAYGVPTRYREVVLTVSKPLTPVRRSSARLNK